MNVNQRNEMCISQIAPKIKGLRNVIFNDVDNSHSQVLQVAGSIVARAGEASDHIILVKLHRYNWLRIQKFSIRH